MTDRETTLKTIDAALARGIADADAGLVMPVAEAFARVRSWLESGEGVSPTPSSTRNEPSMTIKIRLPPHTQK